LAASAHCPDDAGIAVCAVALVRHLAVLQTKSLPVHESMAKSPQHLRNLQNLPAHQGKCGHPLGVDPG